MNAQTQVKGDGDMRINWRRWLIGLCTLLFMLGVPVIAQDDLDAAVEAGLTRYNSLPENPIEYREIARISDATGAVVYAEVLDPVTKQVYPGVIDWIYLYHDGEQWVMALPGDAIYRSAFLRLSESLRDQIDDTPYRTPAIPDLVPAERLLDYHIPFPPGETGLVTRGYADHGTGKIDIDLTAREIAAVKDGFIVFASDQYDLTTYQSGAWWYWNNVIIEHGAFEYSLYGHIAFDSVPEWIELACADALNSGNCRVPVQAGDVIGLEGSTGYSTNPHLHLEFGQGFGIVPYLDLLDADRDGFREESISAGYVYGEHNVSFIGYTPAQVAAWEYLTRLEAPAQP